MRSKDSNGLMVAIQLTVVASCPNSKGPINWEITRPATLLPAALASAARIAATTPRSTGLSPTEIAAASKASPMEMPLESTAAVAGAGRTLPKLELEMGKGLKAQHR
ncbi:hypothetical protein F3Y22_tig00111621pilonHSYRG00284 [Hibiscus syriacus]|uniref:Uncharacterized protein n=1 Tax=Hibiscus syriacus TaxID=106335 RepID=A0A6A2Y589_HIBSY|nr:hypothetical protein F3Y22_tig00111621pilonHSYRG00284 [Hibiscus syriacus]